MFIKHSLFQAALKAGLGYAQAVSLWERVILQDVYFGYSEWCRFEGVRALRGMQGDGESPEVPSALHHLVGMHMYRDSNFAGASYLWYCWDLSSSADIIYLGYLP